MSPIPAGWKCAIAGAAGMELSLVIYCSLVPTGTLVAQCGQPNWAALLAPVHLVAWVGMMAGATAAFVWTKAGNGTEAFVSGGLATVGMVLFHLSPSPEELLHSPAVAATAIWTGMLPGMLIGHGAGWLVRTWRSFVPQCETMSEGVGQ